MLTEPNRLKVTTMNRTVPSSASFSLFFLGGLGLFFFFLSIVAISDLGPLQYSVRAPPAFKDSIQYVTRQDILITKQVT